MPHKMTSFGHIGDVLLLVFSGAEEASGVWHSASLWADVRNETAGGEWYQCPGNRSQLSRHL